ncbi:MAG: FKBP-type peptidyl-prolyl cis-trans isomerase [Actinomycetota bacterium]|nr:FKBP-type peptidyl-prolyl cis-trans isomerase [Actinomycetota bacterium]
MKPRRTAQALLAAVVLAAAGCGGDDKSDGSPSSSPSSSGAEAETVARKLQVSTDLKKKPTVPTLSGLPPEELVTKDVVPGSGPAAKDGDKITVQYVGVSYSSDKEFDSSWGKKPFETALASPGIIEGWVKGIVGMKEGGRRVLLIPPNLAYGDAGQPPDIAPFETLIFVIDLKKVA